MQIETKIRLAQSFTADLASLMAPPTLEVRAIPLAGRRARLRLESTVWEGFDEIARREGRTLAGICGELDDQRPPNVTLATAVRTFVLDYFRSAN